MYLKSLTLENVKLARRLELGFTNADGSPRMWTVVIAENGACKTTVLRSIALAASGVVRANQLAEVDTPSFRDRRQLSAQAQVKARFSFELSGHTTRSYPGIHEHGELGRPSEPPELESRLSIGADRSDFDGVSSYAGVSVSHPDPLKEARSRNLSDWVVMGYGTSRLLPRPMSSERTEDLALSRLLPLFDRGRIIGTGFADILDSPREFARALKAALVSSGLLPLAEDLELRGRGGVSSASNLVEGHRFAMRYGRDELRLPATWLSQGYQATIAWIADVVGQFFLDAGKPVDPAEMCGLVLIDEIDIHLHPRWQRTLIPTLKTVFPNLQFVVTTHSPMILPGLKPEEIVVLRLNDEGNVEKDSDLPSPALMTASEIYRNFFDLDAVFPNQLGADLRRYGFLVGNPVRTDEEEAEMEQLLGKLQSAGVDPGWEPVERTSPLFSQS